MNEQNFIENNIQIISKQTMDLFLQQNNPSELISVYLSKYYAIKYKWSNGMTLTEYIAELLKWTVGKVSKIITQLDNLLEE